MSGHSRDEERQDGPGRQGDRDDLSRPEEILSDGAHGEGVNGEAASDEEAVLAYNANAERPDEGPGTGGADASDGPDGRPE